jgi:hypothetical protein
MTNAYETLTHAVNRAKPYLEEAMTESQECAMDTFRTVYEVERESHESEAYESDTYAVKRIGKRGGEQTIATFMPLSEALMLASLLNLYQR